MDVDIAAFVASPAIPRGSGSSWIGSRVRPAASALRARSGRSRRAAIDPASPQPAVCSAAGPPHGAAKQAPRSRNADRPRPAAAAASNGQPLRLEVSQVLQYERDGYTLTKRLFTPAEVEKEIRPSMRRAFEAEELAAIKQKVLVVAGEKAYEQAARSGRWKEALAQIPQEFVPFLQAFNLHRRHQPVLDLVRSPRLAAVAAQLLGARRVRLYQDSMFLKRPGDGPTHWHSDLTMAPFDTNDLVTAWIPLTPVPRPEDGGTQLVYARGSHRDFALNFWGSGGEDLSGRYREHVYGALSLGDVAWHHGWTLHFAPGNATGAARLSLAVSYFADGARLLPKACRRAPEEEDASSYAEWARELRPGAAARHPLLPLVFESS